MSRKPLNVFTHVKITVSFNQNAAPALWAFALEKYWSEPFDKCPYLFHNKHNKKAPLNERENTKRQSKYKLKAYWFIYSFDLYIFLNKT